MDATMCNKQTIETIQDRLTYILNKEEIGRVEVSIGEDGNPFIRLDMHEWSTCKARTVLNKLILLNREAFCIDLVHGYLHGTKIKAMLTHDYSNQRVLLRRGYNENPGITFMKIAAAA